MKKRGVLDMMMGAREREKGRKRTKVGRLEFFRFAAFSLFVPKKLHPYWYFKSDHLSFMSGMIE
jgi:hypothetical protein